MTDSPEPAASRDSTEVASSLPDDLVASLAAANVTPERTDDPDRVLDLVARDGVAIVSGVGPGAAAAVQLAHRVFADRASAVPEAALVREGGVMDRRPAGLDHSVRSNAHTDGYSYGDHYPDHFLLACDRHCPEGGESILLDGYALLDALAATPATSWVAEGLRTVVVDQTEEGKRTAVSTIVQTSPSGRTMLRRTIDQRPALLSADPARDAEMIATWKATIEAAVDAVPAAQRTRLGAGEAVVIDNYRMLHGREPYTDLERTMWRVWVWTDTCVGVPEGLLHSDSRYAGAR